MARNKKLQSKPLPDNRMTALLEEFIEWMQMGNASVYTIHNRRASIAWFIRWAYERGIEDPVEVTRPVLQNYQRHLFYYRQKNGEPLSFRTQYANLVPVRSWFRWLVRNNRILHNPAADLDMPRIGQRLPRAVLSESEAERVMAQPDIGESLGLRDRAILETFYSTGIRRTELVNLKLYNLDRERGTLSVWQGKGKKDRIIPIGERALAWIGKYLREARPRLAGDPDDGTVFLSVEGGPFHPDRLSALVREHVDAANLDKRGACHMFRHTMATLMLEGGADIRYIQQMLGHADLESTLVYTQVSIRSLKQIHTATHPGATLAGHLPTPKQSGSEQPPEKQPGPGAEALHTALRRELDREAEEDREEPDK
jgi:integrase/recombinase XerD